MSRPIALLFVLAAASVVALIVAGTLTASYRDGDFMQFYAGASAVREHASPYDLEWWVAFHERQGSAVLRVAPQPAYGAPGWTTPYPLWAYVVVLPLALLPLDAAAAFWLVAQIFLAVIGLWVLGRTVSTAWRRDMSVVTLLVVASQPAWYVPFAGNLTGFLFGALCASLAAAIAGRPVLSGAFLALAIIKPQSLMVVGLGLLVGLPRPERIRFLKGAMAVAIPLIAAAFLLDPGWVPGWWRSLTALQASEFSNATGWTIGRLISAPAPAGSIVSLAAIIGMLCSLAVWWYLRHPALPWLAAGTIPVSVFVAPHGWTHEHLYIFAGIPVIVAAMPSALPKRVPWLLALAVVFDVVPWVLYAVRQGRSEELSALVPVACFLFVVWAERHRRDLPAVRTRLVASAGNVGRVTAPGRAQQS